MKTTPEQIDIWRSLPSEHQQLEFKESLFHLNPHMRHLFGHKELIIKEFFISSKPVLGAGAILPFDPEQGRRHAKYVPFWVGDVKQ